MTLQPAPEILTMEDVRRSAEASRERPGGEWAAGWVARLCATAEHWHREAQGKASVGAGIEALKGAFESTIPRDKHAEVVEELNRLRAQVTKDREDAEKWRTLMSEAEEHLKEPEHAAFIERTMAAIAEGEEELRLLREIEAAELEYPGKRHEEAWAAINAFRARQREGAGAA